MHDLFEHYHDIENSSQDFQYILSSNAVQDQMLTRLPRIDLPHRHRMSPLRPLDIDVTLWKAILTRLLPHKLRREAVIYVAFESAVGMSDCRVSRRDSSAFHGWPWKAKSKNYSRYQ